MATRPRPAGRPRDTSIDERVLAATRELLVEEGFDATTVQAIAARSGAHASAIYRRWPSRIEIIEQVVFPGLAPVDIEPTGDLRQDLRRFVRRYAASLGSPVARAAMPGLLSAYQHTERRRAPDQWLAVSARPQFLDILRAAPPASVDPDVDPDDVFDMILAAVVARALIPTVAERNRPLERIVDMAERLLRPATTTEVAGWAES